MVMGGEDCRKDPSGDVEFFGATESKCLRELQELYARFLRKLTEMNVLQKK